jgi:outer membrane immunogenic protein
MKNKMSLLVASMLILTLAGAARAADGYSWTGCSLGGHLGYGRGNTNFADSSRENIIYNGSPSDALIDYSENQNPASVDQDGMLLGGQIGCDYEFHKVVVGISGSIDGAAINGNGADNYSYNYYGSGMMTSKTDSLTDVSLRAGYDWDSTLLYVKAGLAWAHNRYTISGYSDDGLVFNGSNTLNGVVLGLGGEWPVSKNLTAYVEADRYNFPGSTAKMVADYDGSQYLYADVNVSEAITAVKVGVNYRWSLAGN